VKKAASPEFTPPPPSPPKLTNNILLEDLQSLLEQYTNLCNLLQIIVNQEEADLAVTCLSTIYGSVQIIQTQLSIATHFEPTLISSSAILSLIEPIVHTQLWHQLFFPHTTIVRNSIHTLLVQLELIVTFLIPDFHYKQFRIPTRTISPSIIDQIINQPIAILDPFILALRQNYYYPIAPTDIMTSEDTPMENHINNSSSPTQSPKRSAPTNHPITVESSLEAIADLIKEVEADDPLTEVAVQQPSESGKKHYTHCFAMYRKQTYPTPGAPSNQLALFQSFVKSIKSADQTAKILPIHSDVKIYPLSTTDQINTLEHIGLSSYFKTIQAHPKDLIWGF
jgi:hypothetical protein